MTTKTAEALEGSIENWELIRDGKRAENTENCTLCKKYWDSVDGRCAGCPVREKTRLVRCNGSPYEEWRDHMDSHRDKAYRSVMCRKCKQIASKEVDFLKSLRVPEEEMEGEARPQAGDVWIKDATEGLPVVFYGSGDDLVYMYTSDGMKGSLKVDNLIKRWGYTRIFSLSEHLKNKEEGGE